MILKDERGEAEAVAESQSGSEGCCATMHAFAKIPFERVREAGGVGPRSAGHTGG